MHALWMIGGGLAFLGGTAIVVSRRRRARLGQSGTAAQVGQAVDAATDQVQEAVEQLVQTTEEVIQQTSNVVNLPTKLPSLASRLRGFTPTPVAAPVAAPVVAPVTIAPKVVTFSPTTLKF